MFHPKSIPGMPVSPLCIAVPAEDGLVKLSLNSTQAEWMLCRPPPSDGMSMLRWPRGCSQR